MLEIRPRHGFRIHYFSAPVVRTTKMTIAAALLAVGCREGPSRGELERLRAEARAEDARLRAVDAAVIGPWRITIRTGAPGVRASLSIEELAARADTEFETVGPSPGTAYASPHRFRGVRLARLLDGVDAGADGEVTLLGADGFFTTLRLEDVTRHPIVVAVQRDGAPIARADGGPVLVAIPLSRDADLAARYGETGFCFYLTGVVVGRPRPRLDVGGAPREPGELARAGLVTRRQVARFRRGWPAGEGVALTGVPLSALVGAGGARVTSFGRAEEDALVLTREEIASCDPLVVVGGDPVADPIPPSAGGPALLAPLPTCAAGFASRPWPAFVDAIEAAP